MTGRRLRRAVAPFVAAVIVSGHVGTDDVFFAGRAGPYGVRVSVRQPGVIPGLADITVRVEDDGVKHVLVTALRRVRNLGSAPPPDTATVVTGETKLYAAQLWLMTRGSHSVIVTVDGVAGTGQVTVPVMARATRRIGMTRQLGIVMAAGGLFLVVGLLTIFAAAARESALDADAEPGPADRRRARWAVGVTGAIVCLLLLGGWRWVGAEAKAYAGRVDRPWSVTAAVRGGERGRELDLAITDSVWVMRTDSAWLVRNNRLPRAELIPDHGKMMHMFLVGDSDQSSFAHVHPTRTGANSFRVPFPPLPAGRYRVYADIAHEDGSSQTLVTIVDAPAEPAPGTPVGGGTRHATVARATPKPNEPDPDDAWWTGAAAAGGVARVADGFTVRWTNAGTPLVAGRDGEPRFEVTDSLGARVSIEPYMGMQGHAMLARADGQVFMHLHPAGTISVAAQKALSAAAETSGGSRHHAMAEPAIDGEGSGVVGFPLVIPRPGRYRLWVQVKLGGEVRTAAFEAAVR
jgi:hypothetical protein